MKNKYNNIVCLVSSILIVMLMNYDFNVKVSLFSFGLGIGIFFLLMNFKRNKISILTLVNAFLFSLFLEIGVCYQKGKSLSYLWHNISTFLISILNIVVFTFLLYLLLDFLFNKFQNMKERKAKSKIGKFILEDHPFLSAFLITIGISLFYLIFFYPGAMSYDGLWQLDVYYGINVTGVNHPSIIGFSDHHPAIITLIMGFLMNIGRNILNDNLGMFLFILPQMIINALIYAYVLKIMKKLETPLIIRVISLIFYSAFPFMVINSITYVKDTLFYLIFLFIFVYIYYHFRVEYKTRDKKKYLVLALLYFLLYLTRNTGFYIAIFTFLGMILGNIKSKKEVSMGFACLLVFVTGIHLVYHKIFLPSMNIKEASVREMLSVPLQQTARYLKYYPSDLSEKERNVLNDLFNEKLEEVRKLYQPNKSDNVKWKFKEYPTNAELKDYFKVWFSMFRKHPFVYFDATLNNTYGYFYPNVLSFINEEIGFYYIDVKGPVNTGKFNLHWNNLKWGRDILERTAKKISKTNGLKVLYAPAFYVWILISASFYLIRFKRREVLIYFIPLFVVLLCALISPVNSHMRYVEPIMVSVPFVLAIIYNETRKSLTK